MSLVLKVKNGEEIIIGEQGEIVVRVRTIRDGWACLAIQAPKNIPIHRRKIWDKIQAKKALNPPPINEERKSA